MENSDRSWAFGAESSTNLQVLQSPARCQPITNSNSGFLPTGAVNHLDGGNGSRNNGEGDGNVTRGLEIHLCTGCGKFRRQSQYGWNHPHAGCQIQQRYYLSCVCCGSGI